MRTVRFDRLPVPGLAGVLEVREGKKSRRYAVRELPRSGGRVFRLTKPDGAVYRTLLADGDGDLCECVGHMQYGYCVHVRSLRALAAAGRLEGKDD